MPPACLAQRRESLARQRGAYSGPCRKLLAVVEKVDTDHVERGLRSLKANRFAVAGEAHAAFFDAARMGERDMHGSHRFFFCASAGSRNSRDAYPESAA